MQQGRQRQIAGLLAAGAAALALAPAAGASPSQESLFMEDRVLVYGSDEQVQATMGALRTLGVDRVKVAVFWRLVTRSPDSASRRPRS